MLELGDSCIQNFILGGILLDIPPVVLWLDVSGAIKQYFRSYIRWYTSQVNILNMVIPILMYFCAFLP